MKHQLQSFLLLNFLFVLGCSSSQTNLFNETILDEKLNQGQCIEGNCVNGKGIYKIDENNQYIGQFQNGKAHGQGRFEMIDGHYQEGQWKDGRLIQGAEFNAYDLTTYSGEFITLEMDNQKIDVPHLVGEMMFENGKSVEMFSDSGEVILIGGLDYTTFYTTSLRQPCYPINHKNKQHLKHRPNFKATYQPQYTLPNYNKVRLFGKVSKHGVWATGKQERLYGKMIRALRYQNITQAVEQRYGLPNNVLLAMIMIESCGVLHLPNGSDDGGLGLSHMQGIVAEEFGLKTLCTKGKCAIVCKKHGRQLRKAIKKHKYQDKKLFPIDDRFHPILNLDAAGRMLVYHQYRFRNLRFKPPIRQSIYYYAGSRNYYHYWQNVKYYMSVLNNPMITKGLEKAFNKRNKKRGITFNQYISSFQQHNYNYGLQSYLNLCNGKKQKPLKPLSPKLTIPKQLPTPCYVVAVFATTNQNRAATIAKQFQKNGYPNANYMWIPDYPKTYGKKRPPQLYQVYVEVDKNKQQINYLQKRVTQNLPQFPDSFAKKIF